MGKSKTYNFYEFFSGAGMARLGLGDRWNCTFANDMCPNKTRAYREHFGNCPELHSGLIEDVPVSALSDTAALAWASFPCQDLSLAGNGFGLGGRRSAAFWPFINLIEHKMKAGEKVPVLVIENVVGTLTSNSGKDFCAIISALDRLGYRQGAMVIDAKYFVPQSRPRLFVVAIAKEVGVPNSLIQSYGTAPWHSKSILDAVASLGGELQRSHLWWRLPVPATPISTISRIVEDESSGIVWHSREQTKVLLEMMSPIHIKKVRAAQALRCPIVGTLYRRTRADSNGKKLQRAEVRFDQISGCLRTPAGGSSRQTLLFVHGESVRSRLLTPREAARLMGVPDSYKLPSNFNEAYHLMGDGVVVPVVSWLNENLLLPLARAATKAQQKAQALHVA